MADYQKMYSILFQTVTKAMTLLQQAQQETEEMYISADESTLTILKGFEKKDNVEDENISSP